MIRRRRVETFFISAIFLLLALPTGFIAALAVAQNWDLGRSFTAPASIPDFWPAALAGIDVVKLVAGLAVTVVHSRHGKAAFAGFAALAVIVSLYAGVTNAARARGEAILDKPRALAEATLATTQADEARSEIVRLNGLLDAQDAGFEKYECSVRSRYAKKREACEKIEAERAGLRGLKAEQEKKRDVADTARARAETVTKVVADAGAKVAVDMLATIGLVVAESTPTWLAAIISAILIELGSVLFAVVLGAAYVAIMPATQKAAPAAAPVALATNDAERLLLALFAHAEHSLQRHDGGLLGTYSEFGLAIGRGKSTAHRAVRALAGRGLIALGSYDGKVLMRIAK
jgi:uncharacterized protein HemX